MFYNYIGLEGGGGDTPIAKEQPEHSILFVLYSEVTSTQEQQVTIKEKVSREYYPLVLFSR